MASKQRVPNICTPIWVQKDILMSEALKSDHLPPVRASSKPKLREP